MKRSPIKVVFNNEIIIMTSSSAAILDVECVLAHDNKYLIKEMSVIDTDSWATQHWIFKHSSSTQNAKSRSVNKWLERHYHRLSLDCGDVQFEELGRILNSLKFDQIHVKDEHKQRLISEYIPHMKVTNLEEFGCPRLDQLYPDDSSSHPYCIFHKSLNSEHCTYYKAFVLCKWFTNSFCKP